MKHLAEPHLSNQPNQPNQPNQLPSVYMPGLAELAM
jgi:hypothetical protein